MAPALVDSVLQYDAVSALAVAVILALLFLTAWWVFFPRRPKNLPPGPRGLPLIGNLASLDPELHSHFADLAQTHGPIYTIQLGQKLAVVISSPALARQVLKNHDIVFANRDVPNVACVSSYDGNDIVWSQYGPKWRMLRKVCVLNMLSNATLDSVYHLRRREVRKMVSYIAADKRGSTVNFGEQMFLTILNVITSMLWGGEVQGDAGGRKFQGVAREMMELIGMPNLADFFPWMERFDPQGMYQRMVSIAGKFDGMFETMIEQRRRMDAEGNGGEKENKDFLQFLLNLEGEEVDANVKLTLVHVKALLMDMVMGGTDTSANSIEFAMAEVINDPRVLKKAQEELDAVVGKNTPVEESHINKLHYLYAIMKESLRLHPALPLLVPHCPSETCTVGGYTIPKGTRVFVNVWAIHRDPSIWENPLEFRPERFMDGKWDFSGNDFGYFPFGSGRRICAGIAMAEKMFMYSLATLLHSFDWKVAEGKKVDLTEKFGIVMKLKTPLEAIPVPRLSHPFLYE